MKMGFDGKQAVYGYIHSKNFFHVHFPRLRIRVQAQSVLSYSISSQGDHSMCISPSIILHQLF